MSKPSCTFISILLAWIGLSSSALAQDAPSPQPKYRDLADGAALSAGETVTGPSRVLDLKGRKWINPPRAFTR